MKLIKSNYLKALPLAAIILITSCSGNENKETKAANNVTHDHTGMDETSQTIGSNPVLKNDQLNAVYQHYVHLTNALINDDANDARIASNAIEAGAKQLNSASAITTSAATITSAKDIEAQRNAYATMSNAMIESIKKEGLKSGELFVEYCPMALNDKGASSGLKQTSIPQRQAL
jgi:hypothetical protein